MSGNLCIGGDSLPAFTGKSCFMAMMKANTVRQQEIHVAMLHLVQESKINGSVLFLQKHLRSSLNWTLRWRVKRGANFSHKLWEDLDIELAGLPVPIRQHYEKLNRRALELNHLDLMVQHTIRWCAIHLGQQPSRVVPGSVEADMAA